MDVAELSRLDEHEVVVAAEPGAAWDAALAMVRSYAGNGRPPYVARLLGCDPAVASGWDDGVVGATVPGFRVVAADRPDLLVVAGRHRFAQYAIVLRFEPVGSGTRCRLESRADFPGPHGAAYRLAVVGTKGHVLAVRRLLADVRRRAERRV